LGWHVTCWDCGKPITASGKWWLSRKVAMHLRFKHNYFMKDLRSFESDLTKAPSEVRTREIMKNAKDD
jgi:hypothetical protein